MRLLTPYKHILWLPVLKWEQCGINITKALNTYLLTILNNHRMLIMHLLILNKQILCLPILKWEQAGNKKIFFSIPNKFLNPGGYSMWESNEHKESQREHRRQFEILEVRK